MRVLVSCAFLCVLFVIVSLGVNCQRAPIETEIMLRPDDEMTGTAVEEVKAMEPGVTIQYFGHACFTVTDSQGISVAIDPFGEGIGYKVPLLKAEVCLITHDHFDHNNVAAVAGNPEVVKAVGEIRVRGIPILGVEAPHHEPGENEQRGDVVMMRWTMDGLNLVHLGDLGTSLVPSQVEALGAVDILFVPVGGHFTINAVQAVEAATALQAKVVIPMHYKTEASGDRLPIAPVDDFLGVTPQEWVTAQLTENTVTLPAAEFTKPDAPTRVIVLNYK